MQMQGRTLTVRAACSSIKNRPASAQLRLATEVPVAVALISSSKLKQRMMDGAIVMWAGGVREARPSYS